MKNSFYLLFALLVPLAQAQQLPPDVLVKSITEEVVAILKQDKEIQAGASKKAADLIETKIVPHFDFIRMTRIAMGRNWRLASPEQQKELADEFKTLLVRTYSTALSNYRDQQIDYKRLRAKPEDSGATMCGPTIARRAVTWGSFPRNWYACHSSPCARACASNRVISDCATTAPG